MADIVTNDGNTITVHCPNTGPMTGLATPGEKIAFSHQPGKNRKYPYTWEMTWVDDTWVGTNTQTPNRLVRPALEAGQIPSLSYCRDWKSEVSFGASRLDFYASRLDQKPDSKGVYVEVKNVHWRRDGCAFFPDTVTTRGTKHLAALTQLADEGYGAVMMYVVQRNDCLAFSVAQDVDPDYATAYRTACASGVKMLAYACEVSLEGITLGQELSVKDPH